MIDLESIGGKMFALAAELYPICRSITGDGVRQSLAIINDIVPIERHEVPSGMKVFDWEVPEEWNIKDAWVKDPTGKKIVDFEQHNLHVLNYSVPVREKIDLASLKCHLYYDKEKPNLIPYRTSYYEKNWGFCLSYNQFISLPEGQYEVMIDSSLKPGHLTYGEYFLPGKSNEEYIFSAHICHPSLANDNLSGLAVLSYLAKMLSEQDNFYSYRFLFIPGTIGAITWLALNRKKTEQIKGGLVASLLGDSGPFTYKKSRQGDALIDKVVQFVLKTEESDHRIIDFFPYGYDERQFCSPGFNLAVGNLTRSQFGKFPEYHTSADNLSFIDPSSMARSLSIYHEVVSVIEENRKFITTNPMCEPQLGKRGLFAAIGGKSNEKEMQMLMLWILNLSDGDHDLLDISKRSGHNFNDVITINQILFDHGLLTKMKLPD